ncbi:MAG: hypothetical protein ACRDRP_17455, partial [Pseudonocardiaceae bacterium]
HTVTDADHIIYLNNGHITETGTHTQLLANNTHYAHLYHLHHPDSPQQLPPLPAGNGQSRL